MKTESNPYRVAFGCAFLFFVAALVFLKFNGLIGSKIIGGLIVFLFFPSFFVGWFFGRGRKEAPRWKIVLIYLISVVALVSLVGFKDVANSLKNISSAGHKNVAAKELEGASVEKQLAQAAEINNKKLPMLVSNEIRLDRIAAEPGRLVYYFYTLMALKSSGLDSNRVGHLLRPPHLEEFCKGPDMRMFRDNNVNMVHVYSGSDGVEITRIRLTTADCKS